MERLLTGSRRKTHNAEILNREMKRTKSTPKAEERAAPKPKLKDPRMMMMNKVSEF
jgi:hypothetical protein